MRKLTLKELTFLTKVYELNDITNVMGHIEEMVDDHKDYWYCIEQWEDYYFNN